MKYAEILTRNEMRQIKAGGGRIYCDVYDQQFECQNGNLIECTDYCADNYDDCRGCAYFPDKK